MHKSAEVTKQSNVVTFKRHQKMIRCCGDGVGYSACLLLSHLCTCMECVCLFPFSSSPHGYSSYIYIIKTLLLLPFSLDIINIRFPYTHKHIKHIHTCAYVSIHMCAYIRVYVSTCIYTHAEISLCLNLQLLTDRSVGTDLCEYIYSVHSMSIYILFFILLKF